MHVLYGFNVPQHTFTETQDNSWLIKNRLIVPN